MKVKAKVNPNHLKYMKKICTEALIETADALSSDLRQSQTMPYDSGALQNRDGGVTKNGIRVKGTYIDKTQKNSGTVSIVSDAPYARRLYFHPEYNFQKEKNSNAGGMWFQPYIDGKKKDFANKTFARLLKGKLK